MRCDDVQRAEDAPQLSSWRTPIVLPMLLFLLGIETMLVLFYVFTNTALFDLDDERSIATWFSSSQLLVVGLILCFAAWQKPRWDSEALLLAAVGSGFVFLSADEASGLHERITSLSVNYGVDFLPRFDDDRGVWIFVYALFGIVLFVLFYGALSAFWRQRRSVALCLSVGFLIIVVGGVLVEILGYYDVMTGKLQVSVEEFLEMFGASVLLVGATVLVSR